MLLGIRWQSLYNEKCWVVHCTSDCLPILGQSWNFSVFHSHEHPRPEQTWWSKNIAGVWSRKCTDANRSRSWTKTGAHSFICTVSGRSKSHMGFGPLNLVHWSSRIHNKQTIFCVSGAWRRKRSLMFGLNLHIFSTNSMLLCWYNLLVVTFPQVVVPPNWARKDFAHEVRLFGECLRVAFFLHPIQFGTRCILRISGVSRRSVQSQFPNSPNFPQNRTHWTWLLRYTTLDVFFFFSKKQMILEYLFLDLSLRLRTINLSSTQEAIAMNASVSRFATTTHGMMSMITRRFFILPTIDKEISALIARLAFRLFKLFVSLFLHFFGTEEQACYRWISLAHLHFIPRCPHGLPWHACVLFCKRLFLNKTQLSSAENILQSSAWCKILFALSCCCEPLRQLLLRNARSSSEFRLVRVLQMHLRGGDNSELSMLSIQVQIVKAWSLMDMRLICRQDFFLLALAEKQSKGVDCHGSSLPLFSIPFSESSTSSANPNGVPNFWTSAQFIRISLSMLTIKNVSRNTHILLCISRHSNFAARLSWTQRNQSLMKNVGLSQLLSKSGS